MRYMCTPVLLLKEHVCVCVFACVCTHAHTAGCTDLMHAPSHLEAWGLQGCCSKDSQACWDLSVRGCACKPIQLSSSPMASPHPPHTPNLQPHRFRAPTPGQRYVLWCSLRGEVRVQVG